MHIVVFGAGAWGTALALSAATRHTVLLWSRDAAQAADMACERCNRRYLPGVRWPDRLRVTADVDEALELLAAVPAQALAVVATPMAGLRDTLTRLSAMPTPSAPMGLLWLCKGFEAGTGLLGHQIAAQVCPNLPAGVLSGPSFAQEVAAGRPTAVVAASTQAAVAAAAVQAFHTNALRVYTSNDPVGVEVGGAVKNVLAIATGIADGLGLGMNARAALITRGLHEMSQFGIALGARAETFMGLTGLGDLVLTATGDLSRNRQAGLMLAQGSPLPEILRDLGHVAEGVLCASTVVSLARQKGLEMPLCEAVDGVLQGRVSARDAVAELMHRQARAET